jgi:hypothetical protein
MNAVHNSLLLFVLLFTGKVIAGNISGKIEWNGAKEISLSSGYSETLLTGTNVTNLAEDNFLPYYFEKIRIENASTVELISFNYNSEELIENISAPVLEISPLPELSVEQSRNQCYLVVSFPLLYEESGLRKRIVDFNIEYSLINKSAKIVSLKSNSDYETPPGVWHKIEISNSGAQIITYNNLLDWGVVTSEIPSSQIALIGNNGNQLPYINNVPRPSGLMALPTLIVDGGDDLFGPSDYFLFYAETAKSIEINSADKLVHEFPNDFATTNFVFFGINEDYHKEIETQSISSSSDTINSVNRYLHHENEWLNFIKSGRIWVGEDFQTQNPIEFDFELNGLDTSKNINLDMTFAARSTQSIDNFVLTYVNGDSILKTNIPSISTIWYNDYVRFRSDKTSFKLPNENLNLDFEYSFPISSSLAWLDHFTINFQSHVALNNKQIEFYTFEIPNAGNYKLKVEASQPFYTWEIDDYHNVIGYSHNFSQGENYVNVSLTDSSKLICFHKNLCHIPLYKHSVSFKNLRQVPSQNLIIVTAPEFLNQAIELGNLHQNKDNLSYFVASTEDVFNEFSSGRPSATAIRDFIRHLYKNPGQDSLRFVLLFGNGSQDQRNINSDKKNFIPNYQSLNSTKLTTSFVSDDFFGLMDDHEGEFKTNELLDLSVGRLPVMNEEEAQDIVDKIRDYYTQQNELNNFRDDWYQRIHFVADDGDSYEHMRQSEQLSVLVDSSLSHLNISKTFLDAFTEVNTTVKPQVEGAENSIKNAFDEGQLIINYTGHGGEYGWAGERVLTIAGIHQLNNEHYPVVVTASCEFARFDTPKGKSAGEFLLLEKGGGAIGLMTTVRLVFSIPNFRLNTSFYKTLAEYSKSGKDMFLGEIFKDTKVSNNGGTNDRNFTLLGDPALKLKFPKPQIEISKIEIDNIETDTIKALQRVRISGRVLDNTQNTLTTFSGPISITLFDKNETLESLDNANTGNKFSYWNQGSFLTRAKTRVIDGKFETDMIIPKNIKQHFDEAKISLLSINEGDIPFGGYTSNFMLGGIDSTKLNDKIGPEISLFMNDSSFIFGQEITNPVTLLAKISDASGINLTSNEVGNEY